jgi:hypothetical protein
MATEESPRAAEPAPERPRAPFLGALREVRVLQITGQAVLPSTCSCCGAIAARSRVERHPDSGSLIVPYCGDCHRHASARGTRVLAVVLASGLAGGSAAAAAPLVWQWLGPLPHLLLSVACSGLPALIGLGRRGRPRPGHSARLRAAWWRPSGELVCTSPRWARELCATTGSESRVALVREPYFSRWMLLGLLLSLLCVVAVRTLLFSRIRVLNLTDEPFVVYVDGHPTERVEPTRAESAAAGRDITLLSGSRRLSALTERGERIAEAEVRVLPALDHLYAPGSSGQCFWLETSGYGRRLHAPVSVEPLSGEARFWPIPAHVDGWFEPNPPPPDESRSTGGTLTALRQSSCDRAPAGAR